MMRASHKFVNRSREDYHAIILRSLEDRGACPTTNLAYRVEMNDIQVQVTIDFLEDRGMVTRTLFDDILHLRTDMQYSQTSKYLISITDRGRMYLNMLDRLQAHIDWDAARVQRRKRGIAVKQIL